MQIMDHGATSLASLIRRKEVSPVEVVRAALERIEARRDLNAYITVTADQAMEAAVKAEADVMAGAPLPPLHGIPYSVKDLIATAGIRTTMGSVVHADFVPTEDAVAVARAKAAGAILLGKTTTPEFGHKADATAPIFGRTLNPINPLYTPGASSSGSAVAVAAGMGPLALGTDGGGSIRIPASCCGIVGLKPTLGVVPHLQVADFFNVNSYVGPMARDVADATLLFDVLRGFDARDPYGQGTAPPERPAPATLGGLKVGWLPTVGNPVDPEVATVTTAAVRLMEREGAIVELVELDFVALEPHYLTIFRSMLAARLGDNFERFRQRLDPTYVDAVLKGRASSAVALQQAGFAKTQCFSKIRALLETYDMLVSPTVSAPPLPIDMDTTGEIEIAGKPAGTIRAAWYPYTFPMNLTGHPALSLPCGASAIGLPIGLQLTGRWHDDRYLLRIASLLEAQLCA